MEKIHEDAIGLIDKQINSLVIRYDNLDNEISSDKAKIEVYKAKIEELKADIQDLEDKVSTTRMQQDSTDGALTRLQASKYVLEQTYLSKQTNSFEEEKAIKSREKTMMPPPHPESEENKEKGRIAGQIAREIIEKREFDSLMVPKEESDA